MNNELLKQYLNRAVLSIALEEVYTQEIPGPDSNLRIMQYAHDLGMSDYTNDNISWCCLFLNWVLWKVGAVHLKTLTARDMKYLPFHVMSDDMIAGDVVILWRDSPQSWMGHVGFYVNRIGENIRLIGGNQSDMVKISEYPAERILHVRRPILASDSSLELKHCYICGSEFYGCRHPFTML